MACNRRFSRNDYCGCRQGFDAGTSHFDIGLGTQRFQQDNYALLNLLNQLIRPNCCNQRNWFARQSNYNSCSKCSGFNSNNGFDFNGNNCRPNRPTCYNERNSCCAECR